MAIKSEIELRAVLATIRSDFEAELRDMPVSQIWPDLARTITAMSDSNPTRRAAAIDRLLDDLQRAVAARCRSMQACEAWLENENSD
jgi:hypothetical protein